MLGEEETAHLIGSRSEAQYGSPEPNSQRWTCWNRAGEQWGAGEGDTRINNSTNYRRAETKGLLYFRVSAILLFIFDPNNATVSLLNITITILDIIHRPVFYLKLNSTL
jgi:hypothetical protein